MTTLKALRALASDPQPIVHGNGFMLLNLKDGRRAHFWGDHRIPKQVVYSGIHNHRFSFESEIVTGRLVNLRYYLHEKGGFPGTHRRYGLRRTEGSEDTKLVDLGLGLVRPLLTNATIWHAGDRYSMPKGVEHFHETFTPEPTITIISKTSVDPSIEPVVLALDGTQPDNEFDRYAAPQELLRQIVNDMLGL